MATLQNKNNLDEKIKDTLSNYEGSNETSDWSRMESMLNAAPKTTASEWSVVFNVFVGLAILGGAFLVYMKLNQTKPAEPTIPATEIKIENNTNTVISDPVIPKTESNTDSQVDATVKNDNSINKVENKSAAVTNKVPETKTTEATKENKSTAKPQIFIMGNTPVFGDMLDSTKGIIGETKEKEETKKAAVNHSDKPIGWDKFLNSDSIKKLKEQQLKDSLKAANTPKD